MTTLVNWKLARIKSAFLGREDHGILTAYVHLEYADPGGKIGSSGQGFGGYDLRSNLAGPFIARTLSAVGVNKWDDLAGKMVWVDSNNAKVHAIKGLDTGVEFRPESMITEMRETGKL